VQATYYKDNHRPGKFHIYLLEDLFPPESEKVGCDLLNLRKMILSHLHLEELQNKLSNKGTATAQHNTRTTIE
jgi:hypothetical protein